MWNIIKKIFSRAKKEKKIKWSSIEEVITRLIRNQLGVCQRRPRGFESHLLRQCSNKGGKSLITQEKKQTIKLIVAIILLVFTLAFVGIAMIIYEVEGETSMPFELTKIVAIRNSRRSRRRWKSKRMEL